MKKIETKYAPSAIGPYSQAIASGSFLFTSGQIPINPVTGVVEAENIIGQTMQVCENLKAVLEAAGSDLSKVVKTTCYLYDIKDFGAFNGVYEKYFISKPARSCIAAKELPKGVLVEVELIAEL